MAADQQKRFVIVALLFSFCAAAGTPDSVFAESNNVFSLEPFATKPYVDVKWRDTLNETEAWSYHPREMASPTYHVTSRGEPVVFAGTSGNELFRVGGIDGSVDWVKPLKGSIDAKPVVGGERIFVGTNLGFFYAIQKKTGNVEWQYEVDHPINSAAAVGTQNVYITDSGDVLRAIDRKTGEVHWRYERQKPTSFTMLGGGIPRVLDDDILCGFADGRLVSLSIQNGSLNWKRDLSGESEEFYDVDHPPIYFEDEKQLVAVSYNGGVYRLNAESGKVVWHRSLSGITDIIEADGKLYLTSASQRVYAMEAEKGEPKWKTKLSGYSPVGISKAEFYLFVSTAEGPVFVLDRKTGYPFVKWDNAGGATTPVVFGRKHGFLLTNHGTLFGFRLGY